MNFGLTEDQAEIKRVARELLSARSPFAKVREASETGTYELSLRAELVGLGWSGIAVAEEYGGQGLGAVELGVLLEELGYACAATPLTATGITAAIIQAEGTDAQRERWLPALTSGEADAGVGPPDLVMDAADAAVLLVLIDGDRVVLVDRCSIDVEAVRTIDDTRRFGAVIADGEVLGPGAASRVRAAVAAGIVGVCQRALDMTVDYVKGREQFGVPVGSFQAVAHRCAQMLLLTESARSAAYFAAWAADADPRALLGAAALAAAAAVDAGREVTASAIQAHGGVGFTWEADIHWLYKRAQLDAALLGPADRHKATLARIARERALAAG